MPWFRIVVTDVRDDFTNMTRKYLAIFDVFRTKKKVAFVIKSLFLF